MFTIIPASDTLVNEFPIKGRALQAAKLRAARQGTEFEVVDQDGLLVFTATPVEGRYFFPFERVENAAFAVPAIEGYRLAYTRRRIQATVWRALDESHWLVRDGRSGVSRTVATTKAACALTKAMKVEALA